MRDKYHQCDLIFHQALIETQKSKLTLVKFPKKHRRGETNSHRVTAYKSQVSMLFQGRETIAIILFPVKHPEKQILTESQLKKAKLLCCFWDAKRLHYFCSP